MKIPENKRYILFGGSFVLANKLQCVADKKVEGLSSKQWFLLRALSDMPNEPKPTITALAVETDTTRQNVTKMLELLCREGYVVLDDNPLDRRSRTVEMTARGWQALGQMAAQSAGFFEDLFAGIENKDCEAAAAVLIKMVENLSRMQGEME